MAMKKAIAYVNDIRLDYCNDTIECDEQCERIKKFCEEEDIELVEVVKEIDPESGLLDRSGIRYLLGKCRKVDWVIVERPWCLARRSSVLDDFLEKLDEVGVKLVCATHLWDCASQYIRRYHYRNEKASGTGKSADRKAS
jgi:DNA invertase Pin-like site-specific DNA recombinase